MAYARTTRTPKPAYRPRVKPSSTMGIFFIQAESAPETYYTVDAVLEKCSCKAGEFGYRCKHVRISQGVFDALVRVRMATRRQQQEAAGAFPVAA